MTDLVGRGHVVNGAVIGARTAGVGERVLAWQQRLRAMWLRAPWSKGWRLRRVSATLVEPTSRLWLVAPAILTALVGIPLVVVAAHLGALSSPEVHHLAQTVLLRYVANTVGLVTVVGCLTVLIGVSTAWLTTAFEFPGRRVLSWLLVLPLALPTYIAAISYAGMFDYTGPAQLLFRRLLAMAPGSYPTVDIQTFAGLSFVLTVTVYPYAYLTSRAVFARQSAAVMEIARCHGYGCAQAFRHAVLPLARPGIVAGAGLIAMETLGEYGASHFFGVDTLTIGIFRAWFALGSVEAALSLAGVLLLVVGAIMALERWQRSRARYHSPSVLQRPIPRVALRGRAAATTAAWCAAPVLFGFVLPVAQLGWWALEGSGRAIRLDLVRYLASSVGLAGTASLAIVILATLVAYAARVRSGRLVSATARLATSGYAIPAAVLAVGIATACSWLDHRIIEASRGLFGVSPGLIITGTALALLAGYVVRFFGVGYHAIDSGFCGVTRRFDEVARCSGMRPRHALLHVALPSLRPALIGAAVLLVVDMLKELPLTMILRPFNLETLATRVFRMAGNEMMQEAAVPALLIVAIGMIPVFVLQRLASAHVKARLTT
ncbi:MAG: iron ABC transporter permease [Spirochaetaceae bacterium]|nr:iron ABC transporter permease [Spirochaetaceae bacterium]